MIAVPDQYTDFQDFNGAAFVLDQLSDKKPDELLDRPPYVIKRVFTEPTPRLGIIPSRSEVVEPGTYIVDATKLFHNDLCLTVYGIG